MRYRDREGEVSFYFIFQVSKRVEELKKKDDKGFISKKVENGPINPESSDVNHSVTGTAKSSSRRRLKSVVKEEREEEVGAKSSKIRRPKSEMKEERAEEENAPFLLPKKSQRGRLKSDVKEEREEVGNGNFLLPKRSQRGRPKSEIKEERDEEETAPTLLPKKSQRGRPKGVIKEEREEEESTLLLPKKSQKGKPSMKTTMDERNSIRMWLKDNPESTKEERYAFAESLGIHGSVVTRVIGYDRKMTELGREVKTANWSKKEISDIEQKEDYNQMDPENRENHKPSNLLKQENILKDQEYETSEQLYRTNEDHYQPMDQECKLTDDKISSTEKPLNLQKQDDILNGQEYPINEDQYQSMEKN